MTAAAPMLVLEKASRLLAGRRVVCDLDLALGKGEVLGLLGVNGAGKSTTLRMIAGVLAPSTGRVRLDGKDLAEHPELARRRIGYLPEIAPLHPELTVTEYLVFCARLHGLGRDARSASARAIERCGLGDVRLRLIGALSKGYRQRVGLAQALIHEPPILILDEPMSGLDPNQAVEIRDLIKDIGRLRTVILSTHNLAEVQVACNRVLIISKGRIVADDTPAGLQDRAGKSRCVFSVLKTGDAGFASQVESAIASVGGAERVRKLISDEGELSFEVFPKGNEDLRPVLFKLAVDKGYTLVGLRREGQNLEQVFRELTTTPTTAKAAA
jgi:gliding motility-associated transport system ATP-binding protein